MTTPRRPNPLDDDMPEDPREAPLKPCPFCGGAGKLIVDGRNFSGRPAIECVGCCMCIVPDERLAATAIEAWNRRASLPVEGAEQGVSWLLESAYAGAGPKWLVRPLEGQAKGMADPWFGDDPDRAIRFRTKADAEALAYLIPWSTVAREHLWLGGVEGAHQGARELLRRYDDAHHEFRCSLRFQPDPTTPESRLIAVANELRAYLSAPSCESGAPRVPSEEAERLAKMFDQAEHDAFHGDQAAPTLPLTAADCALVARLLRGAAAPTPEEDGKA